MKYQLMCRDEIRAIFNFEKTAVDCKISDIQVLGRLPVSCTSSTLPYWLRKRNTVKHRKYLSEYLTKLSCIDVVDFMDITHGVSLNDCFWVKKADDSITWKQVSPYTNEFDETVTQLAFDGKDVPIKKLSGISPEFCTTGAFDKCWIRDDTGIHMIKRGSEGARNCGLEPYCEVLASQVFTRMKAGIQYDLVKFNGRVASKCKLFNNENTSFVPYGALYKYEQPLSTTLGIFDAIPNGQLFRRILICDALTLNTDRHAGNYGMLMDSMSNKLIASAPGYDYNMSMLPYVERDKFVNIANIIPTYLPRIGGDFIAVAKHVMTDGIRNDLIALRGIELKLPFYDNTFGEDRAKWMTDIVNYQIENILTDRTIVYPTLKVDGLSNCMKYQLQNHLTDEQWLHTVPMLCKALNVQHMTDLEREIEVFLK